MILPSASLSKVPRPFVDWSVRRCVFAASLAELVVKKGVFLDNEFAQSLRFSCRVILEFVVAAAQYDS